MKTRRFAYLIATKVTVLTLIVTAATVPACARQTRGNSAAGSPVRLSEQIKGPKVMARIWREGQTQFVVVDASTP